MERFRSLRETATACVLFAAVIMPARAFEVYRYLMPDGTVLYTQEISTQGKLQEVIESPVPDTKQIEEERAEKLKIEEDRANRIASQRTASLVAARDEIRAATQALDDAKAALAAGVEPQPGERLGIEGGHGYTRLSPDYWDRQRNLRRAVDEARERLDDAYNVFNELK